MKRLIIFVIIVGGIGYLLMRNTQQPANNAGVQQEHAAITKMALESEAKAKQAAVIASKDTVAEYDKQNNQ